MNPANMPVMTLAMTSDVYDRGQMYDIADSILAQKLSQIEGVGQVHTWGSSRPAVRVQLNPHLLNAMGLSITDVATAYKMRMRIKRKAPSVTTKSFGNWQQPTRSSRPANTPPLS
jgi:multidrug efflux pump subunit AcrB